MIRYRNALPYNTCLTSQGTDKQIAVPGNPHPQSRVISDGTDDAVPQLLIKCTVQR